jgi:hypothetical protein
MVRRKSVLPKLHSNPTRVWDTFAEPNKFKQYRVKPSCKIRPHPRIFGALAQKAG